MRRAGANAPREWWTADVRVNGRSLILPSPQGQSENARRFVEARAVLPLPRAGEGWGEGNRSGAFALIAHERGEREPRLPSP